MKSNKKIENEKEEEENFLWTNNIFIERNGWQKALKTLNQSIAALQPAKQPSTTSTAAVFDINVKKIDIFAEEYVTKTHSLQTYTAHREGL